MSDDGEAMDVRFIKIVDENEMVLRMGADSPGSMILTMVPVDGVHEESDVPAMSIVSDIDGIDSLEDIRSALIELVSILDTATPGESKSVTLTSNEEEN